MTDDTDPATSPSTQKAEPAEATSAAGITHRDLAEWRGRDLLDRDGGRIGPLEDVYYDVDDDEPLFGTVKEGFLSRHLTFVPLAGAMLGPDSVQVTASADEIKNAPNVASSGDQLTPEDEATLFHHFRMNYVTSDRESQRRLVRH